MLLSSTPADPAAISPQRQRRDIYNLLFWLLLLLFELFLFTLPLFPSGDGPVHIYLSSVLWKLATHSSPLYEHYYSIRHLIQPYSFHYYFLILLKHGMSIDMAEKFFIGLIWATQAIGFRTLARTIGPAGAPAAALLIFPLLLSWPLSAGFLNFSFGTGLLLFALAFYYRLAAPSGRERNLAALVLTLFLLVLAHPIPIMVLICLMGLDLCFRLFASWQRQGKLRLPLWECAALGLSCVAFVFPILIADKAQVASSILHIFPHPHLLLGMLTGHNVGPFFVNNVLGWLYQALIVSMLPLPVILFVQKGIVGRVRTGTTTPADRLLLAALIYLAATISFPDEMNGSAFFAIRMWYVMWLVVVVSIAGVAVGQSLQRALAVFGVGTGLLCILFGVLYITPVAHQQAELEHTPLPANARGLFLQPANGQTGTASHSFWALAFWDGVRAFAAHNDVLLNTPWLQLTIVPIAENGHAGLLRDVAMNSSSENPNILAQSLEAQPEKKAAALKLADFLLFADPNTPRPDPLGFAATFLGTLTNHWSCTQQNFYAVCLKK